MKKKEGEKTAKPGKRSGGKDSNYKKGEPSAIQNNG